MSRSNLAATVCTLVAFVATGWLIVDTQRGIREARAEVVLLRAKLDVLEAEVAKRAALERELEGLRSTFDRQVEILPAPETATHEGLLRTVQSAGRRSGMSFQSVRVTTR